MMLHNPFRDDVVANAWNGSYPDVREIHARVFAICLRGLEMVRQTRRSASLLVHGIPGSGKTHLLRRLRQALTTDQPVSTDRYECLFVWVRLQTSPRAIWRHVRRWLVDDWFRPVAGRKSQFDRVLYQRLAEVRPAEGDLERWVEYMRQEDPVGLERAIDEIADLNDLDRNTTVAFNHLAFDRHRRDLRAWLCGDSLPESALERLDLAAEDGSEEDREHVSRQVVLMLCRLAGPHLPIALCFDQVEALQISAEDREGLYAFGQLVSTLHDETKNLLLISCVQSAYAEDLKTRSRGADYDRIRSYGSHVLEPLSLAQAERIIQERLRSASGISSLTHASPWPLTEAELQRLVQAGDLVPRILLRFCAERFETRCLSEESGAPESPAPEPASTGQTLASYLGQSWDERFEKAAAASDPALTNSLVRDGVPLLLRVAAPNVTMIRDDHLPDVELILSGPGGNCGVSLCTQASMSSLIARLKRLKQQLSKGRLSRLTILRDSRVPVSPTAKRTLELLAELQTVGATIVSPPVEALVALDVLRGLLADAKSGDLACRGETITQSTVESWLREHLTSELCEFAAAITGTQTADASAMQVGPDDSLLLESLSAQLLETPVIALEELARCVQQPPLELQKLVLRHPDRMRLLQGPPAVVFRVP